MPVGDGLVRCEDVLIANFHLVNFFVFPISDKCDKIYIELNDGVQSFCKNKGKKSWLKNFKLALTNQMSA